MSTPTGPDRSGVGPHPSRGKLLPRRACLPTSTRTPACTFAVAALTMMLLTGCQSVRFYSQAVTGQYDLLARREPLARLIQDPDTSEALRQRLQLTLRLCEFAQTNLNLPGHRAYRHYVALDRPYVVWNVQAAPEFSLEPKTWCYPVVGRLDYQGYFREQMALDYAQRLEAKGYDVCVSGVDAYSTLGWFQDPVLSTFLYLPDVDLADLLFHELAHRRLFIPGDTDFNEAFASTVAREGVKRWLATEGRTAELNAYLLEQQRDSAVVDLIQNTRRQLDDLYRRPNPSTTAKQAILQSLRQAYEERKRAWPTYTGYNGWMSRPLNNAVLNTVDAYNHWVPAMESLLTGTADLPEFYRLMEDLGGMGKAQRRWTLTWFQEQVTSARTRQHLPNQTIPANTRTLSPRDETRQTGDPPANK